MIDTFPFGRTGHQSTRTIFGAAAFGNVTQDEADRTMELLLDYGINHIDTAASYGDAELRLGPWMATHRDKFFLATKTTKRNYTEAKEEIHRSLERLRTDQIDLIQLHCLIDAAEWETAMGSSGALEATLEAREQGLVRYIGVTGHGTGAAAMHLRSLERFDFDSVLLPYNYAMMQNAAYAADFEKLVELCEARSIAVQTIKSITRGPWGETPRDAATWYEPLRDEGEIELAVNYVLRRPSLFLNTAGDIHVLPLVLKAARRYFENRVDMPVAQMDEALNELGLTPLFTD